MYSFLGYGRTLHEDDANTIIAVIFVSIEALNNGMALIEFVNNLAKYILRGSPDEFNDDAEITQEFIVGSDFSCTRTTYRGPASQIATVLHAMEEQINSAGDAQSTKPSLR